MREIKFRAWDNLNKVMLLTVEEWHKIWKDDECDPHNEYDFKKLELYISQEGHVLEDTYEHGVCDLHYYLQGKPKYELMQYTGLKDKNGREIYEGDIVEFFGKEVNRATIEWSQEDGGFTYTYLTPLTNKKCGMIAYPTYLAIEVIGNKWENPELLNGGQYE